MAKSEKSDGTKNQPDYQTLREELDQILEGLQRDELDVDQALESYRRGLELVRQLQQYLETTETTVRELQAKFDTAA